MFSKKTLLLTGASSGIGTAIMEDFVHKVQYMITSSRKQLLDFSRFESIPSNVEHVIADVTREGEVKSLFDQIVEKHGRLDILINCVGRSLFSHPIESFPIEEFDQVISVNLRSAFLLTKHAIKTMKETGGNIVHFVSSSAKNIRGAPGKAPYGTAKAGLAHLIHYAASEAADYNIKVNGISPTYVFTPRHEREILEKSRKTGKNQDEIIHDILSHQLLKKKLYPKDLLRVVELLATTQCITGQIYNCSMGEVISY